MNFPSGVKKYTIKFLYNINFATYNEIELYGGGSMLNYEVIGKKIKTLRIEKGMNQAAFAKQLGVSVGYVSQVEAGDKCFNLKRLEEVSKILGKPVAFFIEGANNDDKRAMEEEIDFLLRRISPDKYKMVIKMLNIIAEDE